MTKELYPRCVKNLSSSLKQKEGNRRVSTFKLAGIFKIGMQEFEKEVREGKIAKETVSNR